METVLRLAARERALLRALGRGVVTPTSADVADSELEGIISDVFELGVTSSGQPQQHTSAESPEGWVQVYTGAGTNGTGPAAGQSCPTIKEPQIPTTTTSTNAQGNNVSGRSLFMFRVDREDCRRRRMLRARYVSTSVDPINELNLR